MESKEQKGVSATDMDATPAKGVGKSITERAEDTAKKSKEAGRHEGGAKGSSERPAGESEGRNFTSVDPQEPKDPKSPRQGGA